MKLKSSYSISILIAVFTSLFMVFFTCEKIGFNMIFFFISVTLLSYFLISKYIQKRIEILYRTIHNQKLDITNSFDLETSEEDVKKWLSERSAEIEHLRLYSHFIRRCFGG